MNSLQDDKQASLLNPTVFESRQESPLSSTTTQKQLYGDRISSSSSSLLQDHLKLPFVTEVVTSMNRDDPNRRNRYDGHPGGGGGGQNIWSASNTSDLNASYGYNNQGGGREVGPADSSSFYPGSTYSGGGGGGSYSLFGANTSNHPDMGFSVDDMLDLHGLGNRMGQLHLGPSFKHSPEPHSFFTVGGGGGFASVPIVPSATNSTVPGVIGVSSGSTGGSTAKSLTSSWGHSLQHIPQDRSEFPLYGSQGQKEPPGFGSNPARKQVEYQQPPFPSGPVYGGNSASGDDSFSLERSRTGHDYALGNTQYQQHQRRHDHNKHKHERRGDPDSWRNNPKGDRTHYQSDDRDRLDASQASSALWMDDFTTVSSKGSSEAIRILMKAPVSTEMSTSSSNTSRLAGSRLPLDDFVFEPPTTRTAPDRPILPSIEDVYPLHQDDDSDDAGDSSEIWGDDVGPHSPTSKKKEWLLRMNRRMEEIPIGHLDPATLPVSAIMNAWAKTKSAQGASMVELWLKRVQDEAEAGNTKLGPTTKLFTMAGK